MRVVSVLYHFCRNTMFWIRNNGFYSFWERYVRRGVSVVLLLIPLFALRLLWRKKDGNEPEEDSLDAAERGVSAGLKRRSEEKGESGSKRVKSKQDQFFIEDDNSTCESPKETSPRKTGSPTNSEYGKGPFTVYKNEHETRSSSEDAEDARESRHEEEDFDSEEYRVETTDELYCGYDSTWETDPNEERSTWSNRQLRNSKYYNFSRFERAARDMQNYRNDYPNQINTQQWDQQADDDKPNLNFYLGNKPSEPDGVYITEFHNDWHGDYDRLEYVHTFIQWLFPLQERGVNYEARTLTKEEIEDFRNNSTAKKNLLKSYKLMLDFYGIKLCDEETGKVRRAEHWQDRFNNLNSHTHNSLRITRILKCLGNLGYPHYQAPLVRFFLEETLVNGHLPSIRDSVLSYFMFAVLDKRQRRNLIKYAYMNYEPKDQFVWCPKKIQMLWSKLSKLRKEEACDSSESQKESLTPDSVAQEEHLCNDAECEFDMNEDMQTSSGSYNGD